MPILLQINVTLNVGSTGRICENIAAMAQQQGWECHIVHGARYVKKPSCMNSVQTGTLFAEYIHIVESLLLDRHGLGSRWNTRRVIKKIKEIKPDVIHLHNIHGYYLNYRLLFEYLNGTEIPIVWTFHDCWAFTGHCSHFVTAHCHKWKEPNGCHDCQLLNMYPKALIDRSHTNFLLKEQLFTANEHLHIVPVSDWMAGLVRSSFLKEKDIRVIKNGIALNVFRPCRSKNGDKFVVLGVASAWDENKGLEDFYRLRELLPRKTYQITIVGVSEKQIRELPHGITGVRRMDSEAALAQLYSEADVFVNPTYADTFPTVNIEALACGTPVVTYQTGGAPETIDEHTGIVVSQGRIDELAKAVKTICQHGRGYYAKACRLRAEQCFSKDERFMDYLRLYEDLI